MMLAFMVTTACAVSTILAILIVSLSLKSLIDYEKLSPFECGFSPKLNSRLNFSLQFFLITLIFLIFDVELILMFPFLGNTTNAINFWGPFSLILFIIFLSGGFLWEWKQGMLEWNK